MDMGTPGPVEPDQLVNVSLHEFIYHRTLSIQGSMMLELNRPSVCVECRLQ